MIEFDDRIEGRLFDNFNFVNFHEVTTGSRNPQAAFALHALMEIPGIDISKHCNAERSIFFRLIVLKYTAVKYFSYYVECRSIHCDQGSQIARKTIAKYHHFKN